MGDMRRHEEPGSADPGSIEVGVSDGTRTRGHLDHNQELYQLSYAHQAISSLVAVTLVT